MTYRPFLLFLPLALILSTCQSDSDVAAGGGTTVVAPGEESGFAPERYFLKWGDEFDIDGLPDTTRWAYQTGGFGWTAKERQNYLKANPNNVNIKDGVLNITATYTKGQGQPINSTRLVTNDIADFQEGYFEFRAKFPEGEGLRSAIWMVGDKVSEVGWPAAGEIDIVEHYGKVPDVIGAAVQLPTRYWSDSSGKGQMGTSKQLPTATEEFHVYGLLWTHLALTFYVDGEIFWQYKAVPELGSTAYPFQWPFYLAMNLSAGGIRSPAIGNPNPGPDIFPATMSVDYVRVYKRAK